MRLVIDAGNTRLKWGVRDGDLWLATGVADYDDLPALTRSLAQWPGLTGCFGVNVAGPAAAARIESALQPTGLAPVWLTAQAQGAGVRSRYTRPAQLGADRWAALVGAYGLQAGASLVVLAGTATTVDVLDGDGVFQGGLILPGFEMMRRSLAERTAGLGYFEGEAEDLPRNTADAIHAGCVFAQVGAIERMFGQIAATREGCCLLAGGAAEVIAAKLEIPFRIVPQLVLEGVARLSVAAV
ncbi:MAG: type III pantothenate kinase [Zoogloeaceae bacterium]|nr:type III pantothenate kinase [Zoogloeaceae bacterium]